MKIPKLKDEHKIRNHIPYMHLLSIINNRDKETRICDTQFLLKFGIIDIIIEENTNIIVTIQTVEEAEYCMVIPEDSLIVKTNNNILGYEIMTQKQYIEKIMFPK